MRTIAAVLIGIVAALHFYIAWFEMFAWVERGPTVFPMLAPELFEPTTAIAANQGLYNAFLAVGLVWSLLIQDRIWWSRVAYCFLSFVAIAGIFGAITVSPRIALIQTVPSVLAMLFVFLASRKAAQNAS